MSRPTPGKSRRVVLRRAAWTRQIMVEMSAIEHRAAVVTVGRTDDRTKAVLAAIDHHLDEAREAIQRRLQTTLMDWWRGTSVEQAYRSVHAARVFLVEILDEDAVEALVPDAVARAIACFLPTDPRRLQVENLLPPGAPPMVPDRAELSHAMEMGYSASDESHARVRTFRNVLLSASALIALFMLIFVVIVAQRPSAVPLCFHPEVTAAESTTAGPGAAPRRDVCPSGESVPNAPRPPEPTDIIIVAGLGLLGGAVASALAIRKIAGVATPYDVPVALALLKVPTGALAAVAGLLLLGSGFVPGLSDLDSQRQILAYALVFGYAQQLLTRLIDDRAASLLAQLPSKHPAIAPTPSLPAGGSRIETRDTVTTAVNVR